MTKDSKTQFFFLEFPWAREGISQEIDDLGTRSQKRSPALPKDLHRFIV
jgi:hypothetical protein